MALYYLAGFDTTEFGADPPSVVVGGTVGSGTNTIADGTYCHTSLASVAATSGYTSFATQVDTQFEAGPGSSWTVTYNTTTHRYTIANATAFTLTWTGTGGTRLRKMLGFSGNVASTTSATGDITPYYAIVPTISGRSSFSDIYEPDEVVEEAVADDETPFAVARDRGTDAFALNDMIMWSDWTQAMEPLASTLIRASTTEWTWEHFVKHCRGEHPFLVVDGSTSTVHKLRAESAAFNSRTRTRVAADYDGLWSISLRTRQLGSL